MRKVGPSPGQGLNREDAKNAKCRACLSALRLFAVQRRSSLIFFLFPFVFCLLLWQQSPQAGAQLPFPTPVPTPLAAPPFQPPAPPARAGFGTRLFIPLVMRDYTFSSQPEVLPIATPGTQMGPAPRGDYGDAPDWPLGSGILGQFPTLYNTTNARVPGFRGAFTLNTGFEWLGALVSQEADANDPADPDGRPNLVDQDAFDDSQPLLAISGNTATLSALVTVAQGAPEGVRYINVTMDLNRNMRWDNREEWVVQNFPVSVTPGTTRRVSLPNFQVSFTGQVWTRILLTRFPIDPALYGFLGWDGSGPPEGFPYGEVEDHFLGAAAVVTPTPAR